MLGSFSCFFFYIFASFQFQTSIYSLVEFFKHTHEKNLAICIIIFIFASTKYCPQAEIGSGPE